MSEALSARYPEAPGEAITRMMEHLRNLDYTVKKEIGKGVWAPRAYGGGG